MTQETSALYAGSVMHLRLKPRRHRLAYRLFSLLLDLDELDTLSRRLRLFSRNRFNIFSFHDRDYGASGEEPLRSQVERHMRSAGLEPDGGPIRLLTMPRILGYAFNPLSVYFCYLRTGELSALLYEVNNTFGERHSYLMPAGAPVGGVLRQHSEKKFYVSPFMDMALTYDFRVRPPAQDMQISIIVRNEDGPVLAAVQTARRQALTDGALAHAFFSYPLLTLKVIAGIHWEALLIFAKGVGLRRKPASPAKSVTIHPLSRT